MDYRKILIRFCVYVIILLSAVAAVVVFFDPFFQYHKPVLSLKAVLMDRDNQVIGTLRHFDYDALILGSSVTENFNNKWFDDGYHCKTVKAVRASGSTADLLYFLEMAYDQHDLKYVFYGLDIGALTMDTSPSFWEKGAPMYLYTATILDDAPYLFNKEILLEKIPFMLAFSYLVDYDEGESYNWAHYKSFSAQGAMRAYDFNGIVLPMLPMDSYQEIWQENISMIQEVIEKHPDTQFVMFFPPYSLLWWDSAYRNGLSEAYLQMTVDTVDILLDYKNVSLYYFQNDEEVVTDLDHYMDMMHYSAEINGQMYEDMVSKRRLLTRDNYIVVLEDMRGLIESIVNEKIYFYYDRIEE